MVEEMNVDRLSSVMEIDENKVDKIDDTYYIFPGDPLSDMSARGPICKAC